LFRIYRTSKNHIMWIVKLFFATLTSYVRVQEHFTEQRYRQPVAQELFWTGGAKPRAPKSGTRNKGLRWNWSDFCPEKKRSPKKGLRRIRSVFLSWKEAFSKKKGIRRIRSDFLSWQQAFSKKKVFPGFGRIFVPKIAQDTSLRGAKVAQRGPKYLQGGSCPPAPYFPRLCRQQGRPQKKGGRKRQFFQGDFFCKVLKVWRRSSCLRRQEVGALALGDFLLFSQK